MSHAVLDTLAFTGFGVAFFHAAIPTHWLPFVLTSRVQKWSHAKTIAVTALAGTGHVAATALLGLGITWVGTELSDTIGNWFPRFAGGALFLFGSYYVIRQLRGEGHVHFPYPHEHLHETDGHSSEHEHEHGHAHAHSHHHSHARPRTSDRAAIISLLAFLTFSPCEGFLPFYVSGIRYGWRGFALLTVILSVATVLGMVLFTTLTLIGLGRLKLALLEKYESLIMGLLLCAVGILILFSNTKMPAELQVGQAAPDFRATVVSADGEETTEVSLSDLRGTPIVLYFYPKDDTPGCTKQACGLRDSWSELKKKAKIFGVSADSAASHRKFIEKFNLPFPLLSDPERKIVNDYGVWGEKSFMGKKFMGIERSTFVIDADGRISAILRKVKPDEHVDLLREALSPVKGK